MQPAESANFSYGAQFSPPVYRNIILRTEQELSSIERKPNESLRLLVKQ
jgi:hypothetical protein